MRVNPVPLTKASLNRVFKADRRIMRHPSLKVFEVALPLEAV